MRVRATKTIYYEHRLREPGEEFELVEREITASDGTKKPYTVQEQFSKDCMVKLDAETVETHIEIVSSPDESMVPRPRGNPNWRKKEVS